MANKANLQNGYENKQNSYELYQQSLSFLPGGVTANIKYFDPYPIYMEKADGSCLYDVDGNKYVDYSLCYSALILGHGHPVIYEAVFNQLNNDKTSIFGAPHKLELTMAEEIMKLYPSMEMVRFTNSGLEATLLSIRLAEAYTGKSKIGKFEGHYHGAYNEVLLSVNPTIEAAGNETKPVAVKDSKGISEIDAKNTIILPFNNLEATEKIITEHKDELSAIILEPILGGFIPPEQSFIEGLRKITEKYGIVLIFDEVKTGFRVGLGGAQEIYNIKPDLTCLGKAIGGGFPIGVVGGKKEIMKIMSPDGGRDILSAESAQKGKDDILFHSGTYNGHPTILAAGMATINYLKKDGVLDELFRKTAKLRLELEQLYEEYGIEMKTIGVGSIFNIVFTDRNKEIKNYRDLIRTNTEFRKKLDYELLNLGVYTKPLNRYSVSVLHNDEDINHTINAHRQAIKKVKGIG